MLSVSKDTFLRSLGHGDGRGVAEARIIGIDDWAWRKGQRYGTLIAWAKAAGKQEIVGLLQQNLDEEKATDKILSTLAEKKVNPMAAKAA